MPHETSIGLNIIVEPMQLCVFLYFFSHQLIAWGLSDDAIKYLNNKKVDAKWVVTANISDIAMLFYLNDSICY